LLLRFTLFPYTTLFRSSPVFFAQVCPPNLQSTVCCSRTRNRLRLFARPRAAHTPDRRPRIESLPSAAAMATPVGPLFDLEMKIRSEEHTSELQSRFDLV